MATHHLRNDTTCQNCGSPVTMRFCGDCGQENTETRQNFGHLFRHFAEDLTHYESNVWRTLKYLLFRPAFLTKEFLSGKRNSYVPPVRLYIFISFITFFLAYALPDMDAEKEITSHDLAQTKDSVNKKSNNLGYRTVAGRPVIDVPYEYASVHDMDSVQKTLPEAQRLTGMEYWLEKKFISLHHYSKFELGEKFMDSFGHNIPKALFVFMPLFALVLKLFQKKRWFYFDHAIFTLHYFSFVLLIYVFMFMLGRYTPFGKIYIGMFDIVSWLLILFLFIYFLIAYQRMYGESRPISDIKSVLIFGINVALFCVILLVLGIISILTIH